jgi:hypothetical protein
MRTAPIGRMLDWPMIDWPSPRHKKPKFKIGDIVTNSHYVFKVLNINNDYFTGECIKSKSQTLPGFIKKGIIINYISPRNYSIKLNLPNHPHTNIFK